MFTNKKLILIATVAAQCVFAANILRNLDDCEDEVETKEGHGGDLIYDGEGRLLSSIDITISEHDQAVEENAPDPRIPETQVPEQEAEFINDKTVLVDDEFEKMAKDLIDKFAKDEEKQKKNKKKKGGNRMLGQVNDANNEEAEEYDAQDNLIPDTQEFEQMAEDLINNLVKDEEKQKKKKSKKNGGNRMLARGRDEEGQLESADEEEPEEGEGRLLAGSEIDHSAYVPYKEDPDYEFDFSGDEGSDDSEDESEELQSIELFKKIQPLLKDLGASIVAKVGAVYHFELRKKKGDKAEIITVDLKNGNGAIAFAKKGKADATFIMLDDDFMKLYSGELTPQDAFMLGKMRIRGNMAKAMKFNPSLLPKGAKL